MQDLWLDSSDSLQERRSGRRRCTARRHGRRRRPWAPDRRRRRHAGLGKRRSANLRRWSNWRARRRAKRRRRLAQNVSLSRLVDPASSPIPPARYQTRAWSDCGKNGRWGVDSEWSVAVALLRATGIDKYFSESDGVCESDGGLCLPAQGGAKLRCDQTIGTPE